MTTEAIQTLHLDPFNITSTSSANHSTVGSTTMTGSFNTTGSPTLATQGPVMDSSFNATFMPVLDSFNTSSNPISNSSNSGTSPVPNLLGLNRTTVNNATTAALTTLFQNTTEIIQSTLIPMIEISHKNITISGNITLKNFTRPDKNLSPITGENETSPFDETSVGPMATRAALLVIFIFIGFSGNFIIIATIAHSRRLQSAGMNVLIVSLAVVNLIDTVVNLPLILGCSITQNWEYGTFVCQFNSFMINLISVVTVLTLCVMTVDRLVAVRDISTYKKKLTRGRTHLLTLGTWLYSIILTGPILLGSIPSKAFHYRYLCSVAESASLAYIISLTLLGVIIPWLFIVILCILVISTVHKKRHCGNIDSQNTYTNSWNDDASAFENEVSYVKFVVALFLLWCILQGPYIILNYMEQFKNSAEIHSQITFTYPGELDLCFTWMKLSFSIILPLVAIIARKELKSKIKDLVLCHKSNLIVDASPKIQSSRLYGSESRSGGTSAETKDSSFKVPVLFATQDGLHLQAYTEDELTEDDDSSDEANDKDENSPEVFNESNGTKTFRSKKCDVNASVDNLNSEYESEIDQTPLSIGMLKTDECYSSTLTSTGVDSTITEIPQNSNLDTSSISKDSSYIALNMNTGTLKSDDKEFDISAIKSVNNSAVFPEGDSEIDSKNGQKSKKVKSSDKKLNDKKISRDARIIQDTTFTIKVNNLKNSNDDSVKKQSNGHVIKVGEVNDIDHVASKNKLNNVKCDDPVVDEISKSKRKKKKKNRKLDDNEPKPNEDFKIGLNNNVLQENGTVLSGHIDGIVLRPPPRLKPLKQKNTKTETPIEIKTDNSVFYHPSKNNEICDKELEQAHVIKKIVNCAWNEDEIITPSAIKTFATLDDGEKVTTPFTAELKYLKSDISLDKEVNRDLEFFGRERSHSSRRKEKNKKSKRHKKVDSGEFALSSSSGYHEK